MMHISSLSSQVSSGRGAVRERVSCPLGVVQRHGAVGGLLVSERVHAHRSKEGGQTAGELETPGFTLHVRTHTPTDNTYP